MLNNIQTSIDKLNKSEEVIEVKKSNNPFRRRSIDELLEKRNLSGNIIKIDSPLSNNKYVLESTDGIFYYFSFEQGLIYNSIYIFFTSDKKIF